MRPKSGVDSSTSRASELRRRVVLVRCGTLSGVMLAGMSALVPAWRQELDLPLGSLALLGALLVNLTVFERSRAYRPAVAVVLAGTSIFLLVAVYYTGAQPSTIVWAYLFQTLPYFLAGRRVGAVTVAVFDTLLFGIVLTAPGPQSIVGDPPLLAGLFVSMLVLAAVSFLFEHVRKSGHDRLLVEVENRRRAESEARRASEVAAKAAVAQARFLANMSHEIRTPMNGVLGVNELLLMTDLTAEQRDYAETINASGQSLLTVLNDVLDLSKIESGYVTIERRSFDLVELLGSLVALYTPEAQKKGLLLSIDVADDVPRVVEGDAQRLRQVIANLVRNAVKFTPEGHVKVVVIRHDREQRVRFEIRDTGIGLTPAQKMKIFDAFQQADTSTTRRYGGTGLGLSISKQLVELMGGQIGAEGRPGKGSVFWFIVRLSPSEAHSGDSQPRRAAAPLTPPVERRVLVVEDNPVNRKVVCRMLERLNFSVETAEDGQYAVEMWRPGRYALVFMDVQMPRLDGYDTARHLRRNEDHDLRTPIIALTANAMQGDRERCLAAGMDDYLSKPVVFRDLERVVKQWVSVEGPAVGGATREASAASPVGREPQLALPHPSSTTPRSPPSTTAS